jgi:queuine tRNA-ribosyltransferase
MKFTIEARDPSGGARTGILELPRGRVRTPAFMPVGTAASVKGLCPRDLAEIGAEILLANTYHLMLRPGEELVRDFGGVSNFMGWRGPLLTDSGGYQVFSLASNRTVGEDGVLFRSHIDGTEHQLSPERAVEIQAALNPDIMMALDICPPRSASRAEVEKSLRLTHAWARRCVAAKAAAAYRQRFDARAAGGPDSAVEDAQAPFERWLEPADQTLFPIVQGGVFMDLRTRSAEVLTELDAEGYAIGGVSVGEGAEAMEQVVRHTAPLLPADRPRYLMGVGHPRDMLMAIGAGVDMFDCVLPTRNGRNGQALTADGPLRLKNARHRASRAPLEEGCDCYACRNFSRGYLRHLFLAGEMLASILASLHNVRFLLRLMEDARAAVRENRFAAFARERTERFERGEA